MGDELDLLSDEAIDGAWDAFRGRLADHLVEPTDGFCIDVESGVGEDELDGCAPYVQFDWTDDLLHAEAVSNHYLDKRYQFDALEARGWFEDYGWHQPDAGHRNYYLSVPENHVDQVAVATVEVLREVYGVPHPMFLQAEGLERDPSDVAPVATEDGVGEPDAVFPNTHEELVALVDATLGEIFHEVVKDDDGDIPCRAGESMVFVRVLDDRPAVELFAEIVVDPTDVARLPVELDILNRTHDFARFYVFGTSIRMSFQVIAWPFAPEQLRVVLRRMLGEVDDIAVDLVARVGGRRFCEESAPVAQPPAHPGLVGLLELLHVGEVSSLAVGALFDHDRSAIIKQLVAIRTGVVGIDGHDEDEVLDTLRRGLRYVVDGEIPERRNRLRLPPRPRTEQPTLIDDGDVGEQTLDLGRSA